MTDIPKIEVMPPAPPIEPKPKRRASQWPSILQFILASLAVVTAFGAAAVLIFSGVLQWAVPSSRDGGLQSLALALGGVLVGMLVLPSALFSFPKLLDTTIKKPIWWPQLRKLMHPRRMIYFVPVGIGLGYLVSRGEDAVRLALPFFHMTLVLIVATWLVWLGIRRLPQGSAQRAWGVVGSGLVLGPMILLILEIIVAVIAMVVITYTMSDDANLARSLNRVSYYLENWAANPEPDLDSLGEALNFPEYLTGGLLFLAVIVPLIEEMFKPIAVWLLLGKKLTPKEGFTAGVISGAAFGLVENITSVALDDTWAIFVTARLGTSVMHVITAGLVGWGIASAWQNRKFFQFVSAYLLAAVIHGLWNGVVVLVVFAGFQVQSPLVPPYVILTGPVFLVVLTISAFVLLIKLNQLLRSQPDPEPEMIEPTAVS